MKFAQIEQGQDKCTYLIGITKGKSHLECHIEEKKLL